MRISIFGLGYVGCVSAGCLAQEGHDVIGVDVSPLKVEMVAGGQSPIVEKGLEEILSAVVKGKTKGSLKAVTDPGEAVEKTEISLICVGTPSKENGDLDLEFVRRCSADIGNALKKKEEYHVVVARSTMLPGSVEGIVVKEVEEKSGKKAGRDFGVAMNPEFLRESTSVHDFYNPPVTVIGELDKRSGDMAASMYAFLKAPVERTDIKTAEMVKYSCNAFHALKVSFANEIGAICKSLKIDSHGVMKIFCMDKKLNLSPYYLKPGFAFGGSCLPKDLRAINYKARDIDVDVPVLNSILDSNIKHIERAKKMILATGKKKVGILGLSFKADTDDLRESPIVTLTEFLIGKGFDIRIFDKNVSIAKLMGANKEYIENEIPHISSHLCDDLSLVVENSDILIIGNSAEEFDSLLNGDNPGKIIFDLVRIRDDIQKAPQGYEGICW